MTVVCRTRMTVLEWNRLYVRIQKYTNRLLKETRSDILGLKILGLSSLRPLSLFHLYSRGKAQWSVLLWRPGLIR